MTLKYTDEDDKCYGITGMAIGIVIWDADEMLSAVSLDAPAAEVVEYAPEYYFNGNPGLSAKAAWSHLLKHYQASMGMMIGNVLCRSYVLHHVSPDPEVRQALLDCLRDEGCDTCSLEADEVERIFTRSYNYLDKVFTHHGVHAIAHRFADTLRAQRRMSRGEILEQLAALSQL